MPKRGAGTANLSTSGGNIVGDVVTVAVPSSFTLSSIQWKRDGTNISGATSSSYTRVSGDVGHTLSFAASLTYSATVAATQTAFGNLSISGSTAIGSTLTASVPGDYIGGTLQWNRAGSAISGATSTTYTTVTADASQAITATCNTGRGSQTSNSITVDAVSGGGETFRFASIENVYPDSNPSVSPKSNAGADSMLVTKAYKLEMTASKLKLVFFNDQFTTSNDTGPGNTLTIQSFALQYNNTVVVASFAGGNSRVLADGEKNAVSLEILASSFGATNFVEGDFVFYKGIHYVPNLGDKFVVQNSPTDIYVDGSNAALGQAVFYNRATATPSSITTPGKFTFASGSQVSSMTGNIYGPLLVGLPVGQKRSSVFWLVDSIGTRFLSEKYIREQFPDKAYPMMKCAVPGISIQAYLSYQAHWLWMLDYADEFAFKLGTNDFGGGADYATITSRISSLITAAKTQKPSIRVHVGQLLANTSDPAGTFLTLEAQSYKTSWVDEPALRSTFYPSLLSAGTIHGILNSDPVRSPSDNLKWPVPRTAGVANWWCTPDGVHLADNSANGLVGIKNSGVGVYNGEINLPYFRALNLSLYGVDIPTAAQNVQVSAGNSQVTATWEAPDWAGANSYTFTAQYKTNASGTWLTAQSGISSATLTYTYTGLTNATPYNFRILVVNSSYSTASSAVDATPTGIAYDAALAAIFDVSQGGLTVTSNAVSNWQDARGNTINFVQATALNQPTQASSGAAVAFGNNQWLTLDQTVNPSNFDIVFELASAVTTASTSKMLISFGTTAPCSIALGASTGTFTNEVVVFTYGTYKFGCLDTDLTTALGVNNLASGKHVISVRWNNGGTPVIYIDGHAMTFSTNGSSTQTYANQTPTIGGTNTGASDFLDKIHEVRFYSSTPTGTGAIATIQSTLKTKWSIA